MDEYLIGSMTGHRRSLLGGDELFDSALPMMNPHLNHHTISATSAFHEFNQETGERSYRPTLHQLLSSAQPVSWPTLNNNPSSLTLIGQRQEQMNLQAGVAADASTLQQQQKQLAVLGDNGRHFAKCENQLSVSAAATALPTSQSSASPCYQQLVHQHATMAKHPAPQLKHSSALSSVGQASQLAPQALTTSTNFDAEFYGNIFESVPLPHLDGSFYVSPQLNHHLNHHHQQQQQLGAYQQQQQHLQTSQLLSQSLFNARHHHVPISSAWLEPPPAPGEVGWTRLGFDGPKMSPLFKNGRRRSDQSQLSPSQIDDDDDDSRSDSGNPARHAANVRERRRMRLLNDAFMRLRGHVPQDLFSEHKRSKLTILRGAIRYIRLLNDTLVARGGSTKAGSSLLGGMGGSGSASRQLQPQSIVITAANLTRHRVSWRISDYGAVIASSKFRNCITAANNEFNDVGNLIADDNQSTDAATYHSGLVRLRYTTWCPKRVDADTTNNNNDDSL